MFSDAKWKKTEEKEDFYQKVHSKSLLQRVPDIRRPFRMDSGERIHDFDIYIALKV